MLLEAAVVYFTCQIVLSCWLSYIFDVLFSLYFSQSVYLEEIYCV